MPLFFYVHDEAVQSVFTKNISNTPYDRRFLSPAFAYIAHKKTHHVVPACASGRHRTVI